jgi:hypothetical protein
MYHHNAPLYNQSILYSCYSLNCTIILATIRNVCGMGAYFGMNEHSIWGTRDTDKSIMRWMLPSSPGLSSVVKPSSPFVQRAVQRYDQEQPRR